MLVRAIKIIQYEIIDSLKRIDLNKTTKSKECEVCNYNSFDKSFKFDLNICNDRNRAIQVLH